MNPTVLSPDMGKIVGQTGIFNLGMTTGQIEEKRMTYIYIYIYCHPKTDCFVVSQLFSAARHVGCLKLGSKPSQLYVRLSIIPLS